MKTDLHVYCLAGDIDGGCGFYRIREPARVASTYGVKIEVEIEVPVEAEMNDYGTTIHSLGIHPDVIVIQRPLLNSFYELIKYAQARGIACIVEIDDDLVGTHPQNVAYQSVNPLFSKTESWEWLIKSCAIADLVICSSDELARIYAPHGRFRVLRNCIPESEFRVKTPAELLRVGWSGTVQTHPEDLDIAEGHVGAALNNFAKDKDFYVVGDGAYVQEKLRLHGQVKASGWVPRGEYLSTLNEHMDIGIVPLKIDRFNQCKSWLKSLEMASQGIPSVVSPTKENLLLNEITGNPAVRKTKDWQKHLKRLLTDRDFYLERSEAVRHSVSGLTYENKIEGWIEAWSAAKKERLRQS